MKVLAIIPARGGSKGIINKNIQKVGCLPLIKHTIISAKKSKKIDKILISTDDKKILKIASSMGVETPFLRPKKISSDTATSLDVVKHALKYLEKHSYIPDVICLLQPTSPFRDDDIIDKSIKLLIKSKATSVIGVSKIKTHAYGSFWKKNNFLKPFQSNFQIYSRRQSLPDLYFPTGSIYTFSLNTLKKYDSIYGPKIKPLIILQQDNVDIDTLFDLFIAEMKLKHWKNYQKKFHCLFDSG
jgi:CMP-N,N'-diacetyllegionaminic acid synthase